MNHGSLFSGIGGFDLAAQWMGWNNIFHCENNPFGQKVLQHYWPDAISYDDITTTDFTIHRGQIDILTGGFPCQPYSTAGKRLGKEDDRHLWPEMLRAIREIQPRWVVGENVLGLVDWSGGLVFDEVQTDLEAEGYQVQPFVLPACAKNAPHRRERVWFVAYSGSKRCSRGSKQSRSDTQEKREICKKKQNNKVRVWSKDKGRSGIITNTECLRQQGQGRPKRSLCKTESEEWKASWSYNDGRWPTQSPVCSGDDGISSRLDAEALYQGKRKPGNANPFGKYRQESIKAAGNAVVPQVVFEKFKAIEQYELNDT